MFTVVFCGVVTASGFAAIAFGVGTGVFPTVTVTGVEAELVQIPTLQMAV